MITVYGFICFILAIVGKTTEKNLFNPVTVFMVLWGGILILSNLHLYNLSTANIKYYNLIFVAIIAYFIGYYIINIVVRDKNITNSKFNDIKDSDYELRYGLFYILQIVSILFCAKDLIKVIGSLSGNYSLYNVQKLLQSTNNIFERTSLENAIRFFIINPFSWIYNPVVIIDFWIGKRDKKALVLAIILTCMRVLTTGGRASIIHAAFCFACVFFLSIGKKNIDVSKKNIDLLRKNKKIFIFLGIIVILALAITTWSRASKNALRTIYYDFAMQPMMFQNWAQIVDVQNIKGYGIATFNGILSDIDYLLRNTIHIELPNLYKEVYELIAKTDTVWLSIGDGVFANAYVTIFWFFYLDGRVFGIILCMFVFGSISKLVYRGVTKKHNLKNMAVYSLFLLGIFYSFAVWNFAQSAYTLSFFYILLVYKKNVFSTIGKYL